MSDKKAQAKALYLEKNLSLEAIAQKLGVSSRTVERWAASDPEGRWGDLKAAKKVVGLAEARAARDEAEPRPRRRSPSARLDSVELVETALADVSGWMAGGSEATTGRDIAALTGALCKLIELRLKLQPPTAADLADYALTLGIEPAQFAAELRARWQLKA